MVAREVVEGEGSVREWRAQWEERMMNCACRGPIRPAPMRAMDRVLGEG